MPAAPTETDAPGTFSITAAALTLGSFPSGSAPFEGSIAHCVINNVILTEGEINRAMRWGVCWRGILRYYPLVGFATEPEYSGNVANSTSITATSTITDGPPITGPWYTPITYGQPLVAAPVSGTTHTKAGSAGAGTRASGADVHENVETGKALADTRASAADVFEATEAGKALADTRAPGPTSMTPSGRARLERARAPAASATEESLKAGSARAGTRASGADVHEAVETGKARRRYEGVWRRRLRRDRDRPGVRRHHAPRAPMSSRPPRPARRSSIRGLLGPSEKTAGGITYTKAGSARAGTRTSGADVFTATETGSARAGTRDSGADVHEAVRTGQARAGSRDSAADVFTATEAGKALADTRASGASQHVVSGTFQKAGQPAADTRVSGASVTEDAKAGQPAAGTRVSGASVYIPATVYAKTGSARAGARAKATDVFTATETGQARTGRRTSAADEAIHARTGKALVDTLAIGDSTTSPRAPSTRSAARSPALASSAWPSSSPRRSRSSSSTRASRSDR